MDSTIERGTRNMPAAQRRTKPTSLKRRSFTTDRSLEYFTEDELTKQIGHPRRLWPLALLKELIDNSLDACENTPDCQPHVTVSVRPNSLYVTDNGPGIPPETIVNSLNYHVRESDKFHYIGPTRGQQGNALKCLWAAPFIFSDRPCVAKVAARNHFHRIEVKHDGIKGHPEARRDQFDAVVKTGTFLKVGWPEIACYLSGEFSGDFYTAEQLLAAYSAFNPHTRFTLRQPGTETVFHGTSSQLEKWRTSDPASAHWHNASSFRSLIAAYIAGGDGEMPVREFATLFKGLTASAKAKAALEQAGLHGAVLNDLISGGDICQRKATKLLTAMQEHSAPIKSEKLGVIGEKHFKSALASTYGSAPDSIRYKRVVGKPDDELPFVLEVGFGISSADDSHRKVVVGLNWSPAIKGERSINELWAALDENLIDDDDPVTLLVHLVSPQLSTEDRGKSIVSLAPHIKEALLKAVRLVASSWKAKKRHLKQEDRMNSRQLEEARREKRRSVLSIKQAAYRVMEAAYMHASGNNASPANARQIMYAARPRVMALTGDKIWSHSSYFTQRLLPDFIERHPELTANWDVVFDNRGRLIEPYTGEVIDLGTIATRNYIGRWKGAFIDTNLTFAGIASEVKTCGPANRYKYALFIEKEGFEPLLRKSQIAERFGIALMSTKGMSNTAARQLVERLSEKGVTILVLRDFDKSGFTIVHTLRTDTRRYKYESPPRVIDLGLRLSDATAMGLQQEAVFYDKKLEKDPKINLVECGATEEECQFLAGSRSGYQWHGNRIELNAMSSPQFIEFIERKLVEHGVERLVPDEETLRQAYVRARQIAIANEAMQQVLRDARDAAKRLDLPTGLADMVAAGMWRDQTAPWDDVIASLARSAGTN